MPSSSTKELILDFFPNLSDAEVEARAEAVEQCAHRCFRCADYSVVIGIYESFEPRVNLFYGMCERCNERPSIDEEFYKYASFERMI